ncbi:hypothetical protein BD410DRAFT_788102 [Rickenella mellea]|uniref:Uncharacterized protein n=1 Tax=Rickenella mellea TaxID=50990 RepID=A0A4Y7Q7A6_9AGAM|nr:hypothetical protein BD410DRAFT_788102 [Rickenella mellea]
MEYSKRDADLLDIVTSVPEFLELNNSAEARMVTRRSGVLSRAVRLLHSCAITANKSSCMACLECIITLAPCSTKTNEQDNHETDNFTLSALLTFTYAGPPHLHADDDIAELTLCAISNIVLRQVYYLENSVKMIDEDQFKQQNENLISAVLDIMRQLMGKFVVWKPWEIFCFSLDTFTGGTWSPNSIMTLCNSLRKFRTTWVTPWINAHLCSSSPIHPLIWASLSDSMTHLQAFPCSNFVTKRGSGR